jgi:hypothetical protein
MPAQQRPGGPTVISDHRFNEDNVVQALRQLLTTDREVLEEVASKLERDHSDSGEAMFDVILAVLSGQHDLPDAVAKDMLRTAWGSSS